MTVQVPHGSLDAVRARAIRAVDAAAEAARSRHATSGSLQALSYAYRLERARAYLAALAAGDDPGSDTDWPLLAAQIGHSTETGQPAPTTVEEAATVIVTAAAQWEAIEAQIDGHRKAGKDAIRAANTVAEIDAARDAATDDLAGM